MIQSLMIIPLYPKATYKPSDKMPALYFVSMPTSLASLHLWHLAKIDLIDFIFYFFFFVKRRTNFSLFTIFSFEFTFRDVQILIFLNQNLMPMFNIKYICHVFLKKYA